MGSDPRRLDGLRADEQVAARLVERATGATARAHDVGHRQGAYDVHLTYPDGRTAALEVTTHAGAASRHGLVLLGRDRLSRRAPRRRSGAAHADSPAPRLPGPAPVRAAAGPSPDAALTAPDATLTSPAAALTALPAAVSDLLVEPHVARRAAKVAGAGRVDERHLFVGVAEGGLPPTVYQRLSGPLDTLPSDPPSVPDGLTHLWLTTEWRGSPLLGWDARGGWVAYQV